MVEVLTGRGQETGPNIATKSHPFREALARIKERVVDWHWMKFAAKITAVALTATLMLGFFAKASLESGDPNAWLWSLSTGMGAAFSVWMAYNTAQYLQ